MGYWMPVLGNTGIATRLFRFSAAIAGAVVIYVGILTGTRSPELRYMFEAVRKQRNKR
jgi:hypothetical protein